MKHVNDIFIPTNIMPKQYMGMEELQKYCISLLKYKLNILIND